MYWVGSEHVLGGFGACIGWVLSMCWVGSEHVLGTGAIAMALTGVNARLKSQHKRGINETRQI